jgi:hypothetical protein
MRGFVAEQMERLKLLYLCSSKKAKISLTIS